MGSYDFKWSINRIYVQDGASHVYLQHYTLLVTKEDVGLNGNRNVVIGQVPGYYIHYILLATDYVHNVVTIYLQEVVPKPVYRGKWYLQNGFETTS